MKWFFPALSFSFRRTSIVGGWWFGVVWTGWSSVYLKRPFCQVSILLFIIFFKSSLRYMASAAFYSVPQSAATTFAFPSVWFLFYSMLYQCTYILYVARVYGIKVLLPAYGDVLAELLPLLHQQILPTSLGHLHTWHHSIGTYYHKV